MTYLHRFAAPLLWAIAGAVALYAFIPEQKVGEAFRVIHIPARAFETLEPKVEIRWRDRVVVRTVEREQVVVADSAGAERLQSFCSPVTVTDTLLIAAPVQALSYAGRYDGKTLDLFSITNAGDKQRETFKARAPLEWVANGDSTVVRGSRFWWKNDVVKAGVVFGGGFLLGKVWR